MKHRYAEIIGFVGRVKGSRTLVEEMLSPYGREVLAGCIQDNHIAERDGRLVLTTRGKDLLLQRMDCVRRLPL